MGTIKINKDKLIEYSQVTEELKQNIDRIILQTNTTSEVLNGIKSVSSLNSKMCLKNTQDLAFNISVILGKLTEDFYCAAKQFDYEEDKLNGLVGIEKDFNYSFISNGNSIFNGSIDNKDEKADTKTVSFSDVNTYLLTPALYFSNHNNFLATKFNDGLYFDFVKGIDNGMYFKLRNTNNVKFDENSEKLSNATYNKIRNEFKNQLGGSQKWDRDLLTEMTIGDGVKIVDGDGNYINSVANKFRNTKFNALSYGIDDVSMYAGSSKVKVATNVFNKSVMDGAKDLNPITWESAVGKLGKAGKVLGGIGVGLTVIDDANKELKDNNGNYDVTDENKVQKFAVGTTVDVSSGIGAAAAGATIGSIVPIGGTVVGGVIGFVAGVLINTVINSKFIYGNSIVDYTKKGINTAIDYIHEKSQQYN